MKKGAFFLFTGFLVSCLSAQTSRIDTLKVHATVCTFKGETFGCHLPFFKSEICPPSRSRAYFREHEAWMRYVSDRKIFYLKTYNDEDKLLMEGLSYSDCTIGDFRCYYPSGKLRQTGSYDGSRADVNGNYIFTECLKKKGTWIDYDESGKEVSRQVFE